jgi:hypothetical protein
MLIKKILFLLVNQSLLLSNIQINNRISFSSKLFFDAYKKNPIKISLSIIQIQFIMFMILYHHAINDLNKKIKILKNQLSDTQQKYTAIKKEFAKNKTQNAILIKKNKRLEKILNRSHKQQMRITKLRHPQETGILEEQIKKLTNQNTTLKTQYEKLKIEYTEKINIINSLKEEHVRFNKEFELK